MPFRKPLSLAIAKHWWMTLQTAQRSWSAPQDSAISHAVKEAGNLWPLPCCSFFAKLQNKSTQHTNRLYMCREITSNNKSRLLICKMWLGCRANLPLEILTCSLVHKALLVSAGKLRWRWNSQTQPTFDCCSLLFLVGLARTC